MSGSWPWRIPTSGISGIVLALVIGCGEADKRPPSQVSAVTPEDATIERVSEVRRLLRSACKKLRQAETRPDEARSLLDAAGIETADALARWQTLTSATMPEAPPGYTGHPDWPKSAAEIDAGIAMMFEKAKAGEAGASFKACGATCGRFVALNDAAGVRRTSDVLFGFRRTARPVGESFAKGELSGLTETTLELVQIRDRAASFSTGGVGSEAAKAEAMRSFALMVDEFASLADQGADVTDAFRRMMEAMETAYDLYL